MSILISVVIFFVTLFLSKKLFKKWFNHLSVYITGWTLFVVLYEIKLMRYIDLSAETYFILFATHIGVISGALIIYLARKTYHKPDIIFKNDLASSLFSNNFRPLKILILITSVIGFFSAYDLWMLLIQKFGSLTNVLIRANMIYRMRVAGELEGTIPYLFILPYSGIVLSGIYTAIKSKITIWVFLPLLAVILRDMASAGRGGIFVGFLLFLISFILFRHSLSDIDEYKLFRNKRSLIITATLITLVVMGTLSLIKDIRGSFEDFKGMSKTFSKLEDVPFVSPSIYLYFSSNVGIFSKYYDMQPEDPMFGENTFLPIYNLISKFDVVEHPEFYPRGYNIPMWSNSATFLKDFHADFGIVGLFAIPFFLSLLATFYWFKFYESKSLTSFIILVYINSITAFSVFFMISRAAFWLLSFLFLLIIIPLLESSLKSLKNLKHV